MSNDRDQPRPAKRLRTVFDMPDNPLHKPELQRLVVCFLNADDLRSWDLVSGEFLNVGKQQWGFLAHARFGMSQSVAKEGWRLGVSLMKAPIMIDLTNSEDFGSGDYISGSPTSATNQSILVTVSDAWEIGVRNFPVGPNGIAFRDAETLNYFRTVSSPIFNCNVTICGRQGCEIIVTSNHREFCAIRGHIKQEWTQTSVLPPEDLVGSRTFDDGGHAIPVLGCESHLITVAFGRVYLYDVDITSETLVRLKSSTPISEELVDKLILTTPENHLDWSECKTYFTFCDQNNQSLCIWKFDKEEGSVHPVKSISTEFEIRCTVLSENYLVGTDRAKKLYVWDRETGDLLEEGLCDVPESEQIDEDEPELSYPLSMIVVSGDLLVTSSHCGKALCIWNLEHGRLLKRHTDAIDLGLGADDVTSMVYLKALNVFHCVGGLELAFAFPTDKITKKKILSIRRRERNMCRAVLNLRQGEMRDDEMYLNE